MGSLPKPTLSVIVPALDEERNVAAAVDAIVAAIDDRFSDWEILLFDDGSRDATGRIIDDLAAANPRLRAFHHATPRNVGGVYREGVREARFEWLVMVPGDAENAEGALVPVFDAVGRADVVLPYPTNNRDRGLVRFAISRTYTALLNGLFGLGLPYFNGTIAVRAERVRGLAIETTSFAFQAELLVKLLGGGATWVDVPIRIDPHPGRRSKAFRPKNVIEVARTIGRLFVRTRLGL
jgi:glycosyltransferase involved in cell wall biosynthesis